MVSVDQFLDRLTVSGLPIADEVRKLLASLPDASRPDTGEALAQFLVVSERRSPNFRRTRSSIRRGRGWDSVST